jgi:protease-4
LSRFRRARVRYANKRRAGRTLPPYVVISLEGEVVEFPSPPPELPIRIPFASRFIPMPQGPVSVSSLRRLFEQLALDPRVKGVVLKLSTAASAATYDSLRNLLKTFRASGKRVIAYAETLGPFQYYLACACDEIIMPPPAEWSVLGFQNEYLFFKDALDRVGVGVDVVNVSPFKSAGDNLARNDFSEESRAQAEWLLDARYNELVRGIAEGRKLAEDRVRALIDSAPLSAEEAVKQGLIDAALYEDELEQRLMPDVPQRIEKPDSWAVSLGKKIPALRKSIAHAQKEAAEKRGHAWITLGEAQRTLLAPQFNFAEKFIGVISVEGLIVPGSSRRSPLPIPVFGGEVIAGAQSIAQAIRAAERDDDIAAVILHIDSSGGSALASDLIAREVKRLKAKKPVVAYMNGVAASGGYFVAALAQHIVAHPLTITGSIGVILIKPNTQDALEKFDVHRTVLQRGQNAGIYSDATAFDEREREVVAGTVARSYDDFKRVVAEGRNLPFDQLEPLCGGRVWTGEQAHERGLVDTLGDFTTALAKARELAGLPDDKVKRTRAVLMEGGRRNTLPPMFPALNPQALWNGVSEMRRLLLSTRTWAISLWSADRTD